MRLVFIYLLLVGLAGSLVTARAMPETSPPQAPPRTTMPLTDGWTFAFEPGQEQALDPDFDESTWQTVSLPHSWNRAGYYLNDLTPHQHTAENTDLRLGAGWYRLEFTGPQTDPDERSWLEFDGASRSADVWLNGMHLGEHRGPFTRFRFDITQQIKPGQTNLLVVKTDNSKPELGSPTTDILPVAGDFFVHGGLYRPARLIVTKDVHIDMKDYGGPGIYASTTALTNEYADISVKSRLANSGDTPRTVTMTVELIDPQGNIAANVSGPVSLPDSDTTEISHTLRLKDPRLWQGLKDPFLYTLRADLESQDGALLDRVDQPFGVRMITIDPDRGLILNGEHVALHGVSYHQDREGKGWAISRKDIEQDFQIMKEMGVNTIRLAHYPHGQPIHELADEAGMILWDEIPLVTSWAYTSKNTGANAALAENAHLQLTEMIRQNFNHPSVAVWGIGNEIDFGVVLPGFLGAPKSDITDPMPLLHDLAARVTEEDPQRASALANCCEANDTMGNFDVPPTGEAATANGANRYFGWYYGAPEGLGEHLDLLRSIRPDQPLSVSEYGAGGAISLHTDDPLGGPVDSRGHDQPEEYMSLVHEKTWADIAARPYLWASWVWNGFDFATTTRREGDAIDINTKGLVTYDRQVRKDSYFFYKANWSPAPGVHIAGRRYSDRAYAVTDVRVYSNAPKTELFLNGQPLGERQSCTRAICEWENIRLAPGANQIEARGIFGDKTETDQIEWQLGQKEANAFRIDSGAMVAASSEKFIIGSDAFFEGGTAKSSDKAGGWGRPPQPKDIKGTENRKLATTYREGDFTYNIPVTDGSYTITLVFMEPESDSAGRTFHVLAENTVVLDTLDVAATTGAAFTELRKQFDADVLDGELNLAFRPVTGDAIVSAVLVEPRQP